MHRFYHNGDLAGGDEIFLSPEESHHLAKVVRLRVGEQIEVINGKGGIGTAKIVAVSAKKSRIQLTQIRISDHRSRVHLAFGIPKATALEFILRRCTELGVASFTPLVTRNSTRFTGLNESRCNKIIGEVCKQCEEPFFPLLKPAVPLANWLREREGGGNLIFCHESDREVELVLPQNELDIDLIIGSHGGWEAGEVDEILSRRAMLFGLGKNRLRTETAALVALTLIKQRVGEI